MIPRWQEERRKIIENMRKKTKETEKKEWKDGLCLSLVFSRSSLKQIHPEQNQLKTPETFLEFNDAKQTKANLRSRRTNVIIKCPSASLLLMEPPKGKRTEGQVPGDK